MRYACISDRGLIRANNEDALFAQPGKIGPFPNLFLVADGMGGHKAGEVASAFVVKKIPELLKSRSRALPPKAIFGSILERTNRQLNRLSKEDPEREGMGTTLVAAMVDNHWVHAWNIGDSRLYYFYNGNLTQVTRDHSLVEDLVASGKIERGDSFYMAHRNVITKAMGVYEAVEEDYFSFCAEPGSRLLLCSDGLSGMVSEEKLTEILTNEKDPESAAAQLKEAAMAGGGEDNISLILVDLDE